MQTIQKVSQTNTAVDYQVAAEVVSAVVKQQLTPKVADIDLKGEYPREILHQLGDVNAYAHAVAPEFVALHPVLQQRRLLPLSG